MNSQQSADAPELDTLIQALTFLGQIPSELLRRLDTTTFHLPDDALAKTRGSLEDRLS